ncbi:CusA/CzcA family heavy metal efflux RND transporter [Limnohabitans sp. MMS-10A-160]|jgi:cobalt-zinc-cadmium resistance protein CzcA|uniref:Cadmium transporter n=1 Tax=uncultured Acidovorax sp. TaxID=158751 RepID=A0A6G7NPI9_9BURK|nr:MULTISPECIES: CusA/CzcA family heavy metal efflux RND transporter [unclassified Limnohabitans]PUE20559.1 CusA/CzcA family heavy metal efflux RND transporter [Limnohabitans sp. MMS-10A-192]PUE25053.1 CusA/CzcA family heavy metal efflux RND transporter [Limnohabitans sp. MMS-10A-160]QIJ55732.1 cadmium transporter [uncultured Acidovorax sp.]
MKKLIHYALNQPLFIVLGTLLFVMSGVFAFKNLSVEAFPDVTDTQVTVIALYPGRAAEEVEKQVTLPIEVALAGLPNSIRVFSHTQFGLSFTVVTYNDNAEVNTVRQQVNERLRGLDLPPGVEANIAPNATPVGEVMRYRLRGDGQTTTELRTLQDWVVERGLRQVPGVADVVAMGGFIKQYEVQPDLEKLRAHKLTFQNLLDALGRGNANAGGSYVAQGLQQFAIRGIGLLRSSEEIGQVVVATRNNTPILVRDVAQVKIGAVPRLGTVGQDEDNDIVTGIVVMRKGENPSVVLKGVKEKIKELNTRGLPQGVEIAPYYDRAWLMDKTLTTVFKNLVEGALLVSLVLYIFLSNLRASLAVVAVIPLALLATFMGLKIMGVPANLLSLGAMDFGIIVDGAVIVIENIMHRLAERGEGMNEKERKTLITEATNEVGRPTLFSMLIIIAAHIPIFALQRHEGRIFQPMALSVTAALIGALIFSLTLVPLLAYWMLRKKLPHHDNRVVAKSKQLYKPALNWALGHRRQVVGIAIACFAMAMAAASRLGSEFLPELNEGTIWVNVRLPASVANAEATRILSDIRKTLRSVPEVRTTVSKAGQPEDGTDPKTISMAEIFVDLKPPEQWRKGLTREKLIEEMDHAVSALPGMEPTFSQPIRDNVLESISQIDGQIVIKIAGDDLATLKQTAEAIEREIKQVKGVSRAEIDRQGELPQLLINIQREQAARYGLNVGDVQDVIEAALAGKAATTLWDGERRFDVAVRLPQERRNISELASIPIPKPDGGYVSLGAVSKIEQTGGAMNIARESGRRTMAIGIFIKGRDMGSVVADMKQRVQKNVKIPANYVVNWSGEFENQERAMQRLSVVVPISLLLIFVLLFDAFSSFKSAALILINVPLALIGGFVALWIFNIPLSVSAAIGFIALSGQAVLNGVVMLSVFQQLRNAGHTVLEAVKEGALQRLRTVLMTAMLAALGLLPMAMSHDIGSETQRPLAIVVIGGLFTATLLTLLVLPVLYVSWFKDRTHHHTPNAH